MSNVAMHDIQPRAQRAVRHAKSRWLSMALTIIGASLFLLTLYGVGLHDHRWHRALLGFACAGLALASFGLHNDTALALLRDIRQEAALPKPIAQELNREFIDRRQHLESLQATPQAAWFATALAVGIQLWVVFALLRDFGQVGP